jgi:spore coat polysaccharide biosynthesis protein SpsF
MKAIIVIPARMQSTRLPGKVLEYLYGDSILFHLIWRLQRVARVVVATTRHPDDNAIAAVADLLGARCVRGPDDDLLDLHSLAMNAADADIALLAGADDPLLDPALFRLVLDRLAIGDVAYARTQGWPLGLNVWGWTRDALAAAQRNAKERDERIHVVPYWERRPVTFPRAVVARHTDLYDRFRVTVDNPSDLAMVRALWPLLPQPFGAEDVIRTLEAHPEIAAMNRDGLQGTAARDAIYDLTPLEGPLATLREHIAVQRRAAQARAIEEPDHHEFFEGMAAQALSVDQWIDYQRVRA